MKFIRNMNESLINKNPGKNFSYKNTYNVYKRAYIYIYVASKYIYVASKQIYISKMQKLSF